MPTTLEKPEKTDDSGFRLTGRHVLTILISVFAVIFGVNAFMIWQAVGSHPGTVTESSFRDSQRFNVELAAAQAQAGRAWKVDVSAKRGADGTVKIVLDARDHDGKPLTGVTFKAHLEHPAVRHLDHQVELTPLAGSSDRWVAEIAGVTAGKWGLVLEGDGAEGRMFLSQNTLFFE